MRPPPGSVCRRVGSAGPAAAPSRGRRPARLLALGVRVPLCGLARPWRPCRRRAPLAGRLAPPPPPRRAAPELLVVAGRPARAPPWAPSAWPAFPLPRCSHWPSVRPTAPRQRARATAEALVAVAGTVRRPITPPFPGVQLSTASNSKKPQAGRLWGGVTGVVPYIPSPSRRISFVNCPRQVTRSL